MNEPMLVLTIELLPNGMLKASVPAPWVAPDAEKWKRDAVVAVKDLINAMARDPAIAALRDLHSLPANPRFPH